MIAFDRVAARSAPLALSNVSLALGAGVHALIGSNRDGGRLLLALAAGAGRPRAGVLSVLGGPPTDPRVRRAVAFVPIDTQLPDMMRVDEILRLAASIRGDPERDVRERLASLGIEALASRPAASLSRHETRAVAIAEATTSSVVRVLLLEEPFVALDPRAATRLSEVLRARSHAGASVVIATASARDARELADDCVLLREGAVVGQDLSFEEIAGLGARGARIRIAASDPRRLAVALADEEDVEAVARRDAGVAARGPRATDLARAVGRAIVASGVEVSEVRLDPPTFRRNAASPKLGTERVIGALARPPLLRLLRGRGTWILACGWCAVALALAWVTRSGHSPHGSDEVLLGAYGPWVLPLLTYVLAGGVVGSQSLAACVRPLASFGAPPARAAATAVAVGIAVGSIAAAALAAVLALVSHGSADAPPLRDAIASAYAGSLGGAAYSAWFLMGSGFGRRGGGRPLFLVLDWVLGIGDGAAGMATPRGHVRNLLGGSPPMALSEHASAAALVVLAIACGLIAVVRVARQKS